MILLNFIILGGGLYNPPQASRVGFHGTQNPIIGSGANVQPLQPYIGSHGVQSYVATGFNSSQPYLSGSHGPQIIGGNVRPVRHIIEYTEGIYFLSYLFLIK